MTSAIKWHGGKHYLAERIVALMPQHIHYVEPFAGGLSVLLAKPCEGISEVVNDLDGALSNFWEMLRNDTCFPLFLRQIEATPFSESAWKEAGGFLEHFDHTTHPVEAAVEFFVRCRQSLAGRMRSFTGITRTRTRRGMNNEVSAWLSAVEGLPAVHARLKRVLVLNRDALDVIRGQDGPDTLFYLDPPYAPDTRTAPDVYRHEMTPATHRELLELLATVKGRWLLSGYRCADYDAAAERNGWHRVDFELANHSAGGKAKRRMVESVWMNYKPEAQ